MDALFWIGQVGWVAFLACGAYVSFCFFDLADENAARTVKPEKLRPSSPPGRGRAGVSRSMSPSRRAPDSMQRGGPDGVARSAGVVGA